VRLRASSPDDPAAAGNIARAQVVTTESPGTAPAATAVATESNTATPTPAATDTPAPVATATPTPAPDATTSTPAPAAAAATSTPAPAAAADASTPAPAAAETPSPVTTSVVAVTVEVAATPTRVPCQAGAFEDELDVDYQELDAPDGGPRNAIKVCNRKDKRLWIRGRVQLNRITGDTVRPVNQALAWESCTDCQAITVALQMNLIGRNVSTFTPRNEAFAYNYKCLRCITVALAYQYTHQVDDPHQVPDDVRELIRELNDELKALHADKSVTLDQAIQRIQAVINRFYQLNVSLAQVRQDARETDTPGAAP
jgi:hypothetical protein